MPETFNRCVKAGGRIRTLKNGRLICFPKGGGKAEIGEKRKPKK